MPETAKDLIYLQKTYTNYSGLELPEIDQKTRTFLFPLLRIGTSAAPVHIKTVGIPLFQIYATTALTDGATSVEPIYVKSTLTGAGQVGGRCRFHLYTNVAAGGWINAFKAYTEFGTAGRTTGLASAVCMEMLLPNATIASGAYYPCEIEMVDAASTSYSGSMGFIYAAITGTKTNFDSYGAFARVDGLTAGATKCLSLTSQTIKFILGSGLTTRYMVLSQMEDGLGLGISGTPMVLGTSVTKRAIDIYTTSASVTGGTSVAYIKGYHAATAIGGVGHRAEFHTVTTAKLGSWANALKGYFEFGASGDITGLASGICAEVKMPNAAISGTMCVLELELVDQASTTYGSGGSFIRAEVSGTKTAFDTSGYFLDIQGCTPGDGKVIDSSVAAATGDGGIRIRIGATDKWLLYADDNT